MKIHANMALHKGVNSCDTPLCRVYAVQMRGFAQGRDVKCYANMALHRGVNFCGTPLCKANMLHSNLALHKGVPCKYMQSGGKNSSCIENLVGFAYRCLFLYIEPCTYLSIFHVI